MVGEAPGDGVKVWACAAPHQSADATSKLDTKRFIAKRRPDLMAQAGKSGGEAKNRQAGGTTRLAQFA
jgi:hypothetical protein